MKKIEYLSMNDEVEKSEYMYLSRLKRVANLVQAMCCVGCDRVDSKVKNQIVNDYNLHVLHVPHVLHLLAKCQMYTLTFANTSGLLLAQ